MCWFRNHNIGFLVFLSRGITEKLRLKTELELIPECRWELQGKENNMWKYMLTEELKFCSDWSIGLLDWTGKNEGEQAGWDRFVSVYYLVMKWILCPRKVFLFSFFLGEALHVQFLLIEKNSSSSINNSTRAKRDGR